MKNLILLHGALGSSEQMQIFENQLTNKYNLFFLDFPGHGSNHENIEKIDIDYFCQFVFDFIISNNLEKVDILGYSMGGYIGLLLAYKYPNLVENITTFASKFDWNPTSAKIEAAMLDPELIKNKVPKFAQILESRHSNKWEKICKLSANMMIDLGNNPILDDYIIKSIKSQVLITIGDKDQIVSLEESLTVYRKLTNANFAVFPNTVHQIERLNPSYLLDLL